MSLIFAYIDPGTGSLLWQSLTAAFIGGLFYVRRFFAKFLSRKQKE